MSDKGCRIALVLLRRLVDRLGRRAIYVLLLVSRMMATSQRTRTSDIILAAAADLCHGRGCVVRKRADCRRLW